MGTGGPQGPRPGRGPGPRAGFCSRLSATTSLAAAGDPHPAASQAPRRPLQETGSDTDTQGLWAVVIGMQYPLRSLIKKPRLAAAAQDGALFPLY